MSKQELLDMLGTFTAADIVNQAAEAWNYVHDLPEGDTSLDYPEILNKAPAFAVAQVLDKKSTAADTQQVHAALQAAHRRKELRARVLERQRQWNVARAATLDAMTPGLIEECVLSTSNRVSDSPTPTASPSLLSITFSSPSNCPPINIAENDASINAPLIDAFVTSGEVSEQELAGATCWQDIVQAFQIFSFNTTSREKKHN